MSQVNFNTRSFIIHLGNPSSDSYVLIENSNLPKGEPRGITIRCKNFTEAEIFLRITRFGWISLLEKDAGPKEKAVREFFASNKDLTKIHISLDENLEIHDREALFDVINEAVGTDKIPTVPDSELV